MENRRILIIDDNPSIHDDFRKILQESQSESESLDAKAAAIFGEPHPTPRSKGFHLESAMQGDEGLEFIAASCRNGQPYAVAFVDVRMPPGMDGIETIERAWHIDPQLQFVICSAYSDHSAQDILMRLGVSDRLLLLRKPCDAAEILLLASAICEKWNLASAAHVPA